MRMSSAAGAGLRSDYTGLYLVLLSNLNFKNQYLMLMPGV